MSWKFSLAALAVAAVVCSAVTAQPAPAASASAPLPSQITAGSPCGAPGVGRRSDGMIVRMEVGTPGLHVDPDGGWTTCKMPLPPADCTPPPLTWTVGPSTCLSTTSPGYTRSGMTVLLRQQHGSMRGDTALSCTNGAWATLWASCAPASCDLLYTMTSDNVTHSYDGRRFPAAVGDIVTALSNSAPARRMQCQPDGTLRDAPLEAAVVVEVAPHCPQGKVQVLIGLAPTQLEYYGAPVPSGSTRAMRKVGSSTAYNMLCSRGTWVLAPVKR